jgi:hypothetical protein
LRIYCIHFLLFPLSREGEWWERFEVVSELLTICRLAKNTLK